MNITKSFMKDLVYQVNGAAIEVHRKLGPGLLESIYHRCMERELDIRGIGYRSEMNVPVFYKGLEVEAILKCDLLVENLLVVELKSVERVLPIHYAQLMTYMSLLEVPEGLMINFNVMNIFREGQKTMVNQLFQQLPD